MRRLLVFLLFSLCLTPIVKGQSTVASTSTIEDAVKGSAAGPIDDSNYIIGPEDILTISVWKEPELTQTVAVRPDGMISLPLLNDLMASGTTTQQLKESISNRLKQYISEPMVTVIVQSARSRKASILGEITRAGSYYINGPTTLVQLISMAGGFRDFAATDKIGVIRQENGKTVKLKFNYRDFIKGKNLEQNILLQPGDVVVVP
ncbi:MAG: polysaccharide biosynthesis/export family protein [Acidobacteriota bacterium]